MDPPRLTSRTAMNPASRFNEFWHTRGGRKLVLLTMALYVWQPSAHAQSRSSSPDKPRARRITIENLITAAPLPADYAVSREVFLNGEKIVGDKLMLTRD